MALCQLPRNPHQIGQISRSDAMCVAGSLDAKLGISFRLHSYNNLVLDIEEHALDMSHHGEVTQLCLTVGRGAHGHRLSNIKFGGMQLLVKLSPIAPPIDLVVT